jgi:N-acetylneuraminic acid mutarotase
MFPVPRQGHQIVAVQGVMFMFGGLGLVPNDNDQEKYFTRFTTPGSSAKSLITLNYLNDAWKYDPSKMIWRRYWAQSTRPTHRAFHSMVILEDTVAVYGGFSPFCYEYCKDVWQLNLTNNEWQSDIYVRDNETISYGDNKDYHLHAYVNGYRYEETTCDNAGCYEGWEIPTRRFLHVAVAWRKPETIEYENETYVGNCSNYSAPYIKYYEHVVDSVTTYSNATVYPSIPCSLIRQRSITVPPQRLMIIHGGFGGARKGSDASVPKVLDYLDDLWKYNLDTLRWTQMKPNLRDGRAPKSRRGHSAVLYQGTMYIFGGRRAKRLPSIVEAASLQLVGKPDPARQQGGTNHETGHNPLTLKDIWGYNILLNEWFEVVPTAGSAIPVERQGHRTVIWDDMMYVYGGYEAPIQYLNDTWHFNLTAKVWHSKIIEQTRTPIRRSQYGIAMWNRFVVIFGGYGRNCVNRRDPISTGGHDPFTAGIFCDPKDEAFYLGDTWHHDLDVCPQGCSGRGTCHYGSCICHEGFYGHDCSQASQHRLRSFPKSCCAHSTPAQIAPP